MDFALDDEQGLLRATIRRWSERQLGLWAADADRAGVAPAALWSSAGELGLLVDAVPEAAGGLAEPGGAGYSHLSRALRGIELGRGCAALAALVESNVEPALAVARWGTPAAKEALFTALTGTGPRLGALLFDARDRLTITRAAGGALRVTGQSAPVPALALASHALVIGTVRAGAAGPAAAVAPARAEPILFLLPVPAAQVEPLSPSAWRAAAWGRLDLSGDRAALVPPELILAGGPGPTTDTAITAILSWWNASLAARAVGVASAAIDHARAYGDQRIQFGQPIGRFESLTHLVDENQTAIAAARAYVLEAAWAIDHGREGAADTASRARDLSARTLARASIDAVQMLGGYGFVNDFPVEKLMRDARAFESLGENEALRRVLDLAHPPAPGTEPA